ncbi:cholecystokinin a [Salminus brasiliensis]|uniref:cholecystokinin a n=1 Tax=Salminus brasiliensis TaxID=930266 RepID=UPI003B837A12
MNAGICACVLLAALYSSGCLALPTHSLDEGQLEGAVAEHTRHTRAAPLSGQIALLSKVQEKDMEEDPTRRLNELLATLISRKGSYRRSPASRSANVNHRIKDRDYLGWMDFGRRSAEEYEYSS